MKPVTVARPRQPRRGMVLYIVTIIIAMLAVGGLALHLLLSTEYEATVLRGDEIQAAQLVQSGIEYLARQIEAPEARANRTGTEISDDFYFPQQENENREDREATDPFYNDPARFRGIEVVPENMARTARGAGRFTVFSPRIEQDRLRGVRFGLVNESTRLHLGAVLRWETEYPGQGARSLMKLPGMTPAMADSILDWIDPDKTARPSGAEVDYYESTGVPYRPRNDIPVPLEELLMVRDVTRRLLFGTDENFSYGARMSDLQRARVEAEIQNETLFQPSGLPGPDAGGIVGPLETPQPETGSGYTSDLAAEELTETSLPWCFLLTTLAAEKLVDPDGNARIYLNDGNIEFLEQQLKERLAEDAVAFIVAWRKNNGSIEDPIDLLDATVAMKEAVNESLKSPFTLDLSSGEEKFLTLLDYATTSSSVVVSGRINVNEASRTVLEAVPELNDSTVTQILGRRGAPGSKRQGRYRHAVWLLADRIVDKPTMKKLSERLTTGGDVYRAQVVGFYDKLGTVSRAEIVVDATVKPPRQIFSKDLTMFGSGFR